MTPSTWNQQTNPHLVSTPTSTCKPASITPNPNTTASPAELCNGRWSFDQIFQRNPRNSQRLAHLWELRSSPRPLLNNNSHRDIVDLRLLDAWEKIQTYSPNGGFFSWLWIPWFLIRKKLTKNKSKSWFHLGSWFSSNLRVGLLTVVFPEGSSLYIWQPYENMGDILNIIWCRISPNSISCKWFRNSQAFGIDGNNKGFFQMNQ